VPKCKSCGAEIEWIKTWKGENYPVNAKPKKMFTKIKGYWILVDCYETHFATCPDADQHRKKK